MRRQSVVGPMPARILVAFGEPARQPEAERAVGPHGHVAPAKVDQPGQADQKQHERCERRTDVSQQTTESRRKRMTDRAPTGRAHQRSFQRATGHHHADEAQPQADRARTAQARAARQRRSDETPQKRNEPDGRCAEPAENYRVHTRHRRMTDTRKTRSVGFKPAKTEPSTVDAGKLASRKRAGRLACRAKVIGRCARRSACRRYRAPVASAEARASARRCARCE